MQDQLLTVRDIMRILNISRRTVYYWIKDETLRPIRLAGVYRFHPREIENLVEQGSQSKDFRRNRKRILIIDDDILVRESLKIFLEKEMLEVRLAGTVQDALDAVDEKDYDFVISDYRMPELNGIEMIKLMRHENEKRGRVLPPEMILTGYEDAQMRRDAEEIGIREFVVKPFEIRSFLDQIKSHLS